MDDLPSVAWPFGAVHRHYGRVELVGAIGGEAYRWFINRHGTISMIPLACLLEEEQVAKRRQMPTSGFKQPSADERE